ncbi:UDP-sugar transporter [Pseudoscourfieldia marina]
MFNRTFPLQFLFLLSTLCSLGGTKFVSMPMFVILRRATVPLTMFCEYFLDGKVPTKEVVSAIALLMFGAIVAVSDKEKRFSTTGIVLIMTANLCAALNGVVSKIKLDKKNGLGTYGLLFYNSLFSSFLFIPILALSSVRDEFLQSLQHSAWSDPVFVCLFAMSCILASYLNFSSLVCTKVNSALTTMVLGVMKNLLTTYGGMFIGDFRWSTQTLIGINISVLGSLYYTAIQFLGKEQGPKPISRPLAIAPQALSLVTVLASMVLITGQARYVHSSPPAMKSIQNLKPRTWIARARGTEQRNSLLKDVLLSNTRWDESKKQCLNRFVDQGAYVNNWQPDKRSLAKAWRPLCKPVDFGDVSDLPDMHAHHAASLAHVANDRKNWLRKVETFVPQGREDPLSEFADSNLVVQLRDRALCQDNAQRKIPCRTDWTDYFRRRVKDRFQHCRVVVVTANFGGQDKTHAPSLPMPIPPEVCFVAFVRAGVVAFQRHCHFIFSQPLGMQFGSTAS